MNLIAYLRDNRKAAMISAASAGAAALFVYFNFLLVPQVKKISAVFGKIESMKKNYKSAELDVAAIDKLKGDMASYKEKISSYERMLPAEQEIPNLLENLSSMARASNVKIIAITPEIAKEDKLSKSPIYQEIPIRINAKSGYHEVGHFISSLENADRFMKVVDIQIKGNKTSLKKHDVELLVLTYVLLKGK